MDLFKDYSEDELVLINIENLGLTANAWEFTRGAKTIRNYVDEIDKIRIKVSYQYSESSDGRTPTPLTRTLEWLDESGVAQISKIKEFNYTPRSLKVIRREIYQGRIDYLEAAAENLVEVADSLPSPIDQPTLDYLLSLGSLPDSVVDISTYDAFRAGLYYINQKINDLFEKYDIEITHYIQRGTTDFENAINSESDPVFINILEQTARVPDALFPNGLTVKQSIIYQLTGIIP